MYDNKTAFYIETQRYELVERVPTTYEIIVKNGDNVTQDIESFRYPQTTSTLERGPVQEKLTPFVVQVQSSPTQGCSVNGKRLINGSDFLP